MTKEQENALKHLKRMVEYLIYPDDVNAIKVAIQAIKDLDKMNGIALDLAYENDDLIEKLDAIRAETDILDKIRAEIKALSNANPSYWHSGDMVEREEVFEIIDHYIKGGE